MGNDVNPFEASVGRANRPAQAQVRNGSIFRSSEVAPVPDAFVRGLLRSLWYALCTAVAVPGYRLPFAYFIARSPSSEEPALLMMVMLPFWTSFLLRVYAWKRHLADQGVFNRALMALGCDG
jgi:putrescine transport system permease protein